MKNLTGNIIRPLNLSTDRTNTFKHIHGNNRKRDYAVIGNQRKVLKFIEILVLSFYLHNP